MWCGSEKIRVTKTTKNPKVKVVRRRAKKTLKRCGKIERLTWSAVEKICDGGKSFGPIGWGHVSLE